MKRFFLFLAIVVSLTAFTGAYTSWRNDDAHSQLRFTVTHLGISDVSGTFNDFDVSVQSSKPDFSDAVFELVVKANSIDTRVEARDNHLKSADFFNVEQYPEIHYKSTSIKKSGKNKYAITGDLTLHGITKSVTMDLLYRGTIENPGNKKPTAGFQLIGEIDRRDFSLGNDFPPPMISNIVRIKADGEFTR